MRVFLVIAVVVLAVVSAALGTALILARTSLAESRQQLDEVRLELRSIEAAADSRSSELVVCREALATALDTYDALNRAYFLTLHSADGLHDSARRLLANPSAGRLGWLDRAVSRSSNFSDEVRDVYNERVMPGVREVRRLAERCESEVD